ncbi:MAG: DUF3365 domain-containing protein [Chitinophagales bacterium]|nr:DUF3365 domain-containing protein [Chitinophagales bacterium]
MKIGISLFLLVMIFACNQVSENKPTATPETDKDVFMERGQEITAEVFTALASTLRKKLKEGGVSAAVQYCNLAALPIVDSLSEIHNAKIRRATLNERNPANRSNADELKILNEYQNAKTMGSILESKVLVDGESVLYYQPIMINNFCLQCHGVIGKDIAEIDYTVIKELYPGDKAVGYKDGELRGIWSIRFDNSN